MARKERNGRTALLIMDMLNSFDFKEGPDLHQAALPVAQNIFDLRKRCHQQDVPVIYLNDNFGHWNSDQNKIYERCTEHDCLGRDIAKILKPCPQDLFLIKPKHSGFYGTALEVLLGQLGATRILLTGIAGNICVLFTANDAHMRDFEVIVPRDTIASNTEQDNDFALHQFEEVFGFDISPSSEVEL